MVVDHQHIIVNSQSYEAPVSTDQAIPNTIGRVDFNTTGIWLYGASNPQYSWDSRYFGAVDSAAIQSVVRPLWITFLQQSKEQ